MKIERTRHLTNLVLICVLAFQLSALGQQIVTASADYQVYFSPRGGATSAIAQTIDGAKSSVLVQAYSFTSTTIAEALARAHNRGVDVQVILDKTQNTQQSSVAEILIQSRIPTWIDAVHAIAHNKVIVIDSGIVITGSFNFTKAAEDKNVENLLIIRSEELAVRFLENWNIHQKHSVPFFQRSTPE